MGMNIYFLAVEIDEKGHTDRDPTFEEKRYGALEKKRMMKIMKSVEYKHLLVSLKTDNWKN